MPEPNPLYQAAGQIFAFFEQQGWRSCLIGGMAVLRWGRPRATQDVDVSLFTDFGNEEKFVDSILAHFPRRTSANDLIVSKAFANRPIDWMDVEGIAVRQKRKLNWKFIETELTHRCESIEDHEPIYALQRLRAKLKR